jgi:DNA-binding response OmpR family regulator
MAQILVLDADIALLAQTLVDDGHQVFCTRDSAEAERIANETKPQIVMAELTVGGLDLCQALRRAGSDAYFMLVSGRILRERAAGASETGVDEYLLKPIRPRVLLKRIEAARAVIESREQARRSRTQ